MIIMRCFLFPFCLIKGGWHHINVGTWGNVRDAGFDHTASQRRPDAWRREPTSVTCRARAWAHGLWGHILHHPIPGREGRRSRRRLCGRRGDQLTTSVIFFSPKKVTESKVSKIYWNNQLIMLTSNYNHPHPRCTLSFSAVYQTVKDSWRWDARTCS